MLTKITQLNTDQSEAVQTELVKLADSDYSPSNLIYKHYGDLKVFRCGGEMRVFGVILENLSYISDFDNLVIVIHVSEHDYNQAGVQKSQARKLQAKYGGIDSESEFYNKLDGVLLEASDLRELL